MRGAHLIPGTLARSQEAADCAIEFSFTIEIEDDTVTDPLSIRSRQSLATSTIESTEIREGIDLRRSVTEGREGEIVPRDITRGEKTLDSFGGCDRSHDPDSITEDAERSRKKWAIGIEYRFLDDRTSGREFK